MKYMLLVHHDEVSFAARSESERQQLMQESIQLANELHSAGKYLKAAPLHPCQQTITCLRRPTQDKMPLPRLTGIADPCIVEVDLLWEKGCEI